MRFIKVMEVGAVVIAAVSAGAMPAFALYVPSRLFVSQFTDQQDILGTTATNIFTNSSGTTTNNLVFQNITPFPSSYTLEETGLTGSFPPDGQPGGMFERNEHQIRLATNGETSNGQAQGHKFQRRESWDIAFDVKMESPNVAPRKEAGLYFKSPIGNSIFNVTSNDGFYSTGPGTISEVYPDVLPGYAFSGGSGPLGDYNHNGTVDAADYTVWRDTLGVMDDGVDPPEDLRANGSNEGASLNTIDQADYEVWKQNFGMSSPPAVNYNLGDTLRIRLIYTPPELTDPELPDSGVAVDPNISAPGTIEYLISLNGGAVNDSGPLPFTNIWQGIPNGTQIALRVQNVATAAVVDDSSTVTFSNFDFNGDLPGTGLPGSASISIAGAVPEPGSLMLLAIAAWTIGLGRRRGRIVK
jgi:PEP-CTERM motif